MIRRVLWLVLFGLIAWLVRSVLASLRPPAKSPAGTPKMPATAGRMVRDRVCNTFLPVERAIVVELEGAKHYFCSDRCRTSFLERGRAAS
jgi:YHS domain-containing protein